MAILIFIIGSLIGSFLNVCIHRLPRGESLLRPRSHCSQCHQILTWRDLIPVASFFRLRGRCRYCQAPIPAYHVIVEILVALIGMRVFQIYGWSWSFLTAALFCSVSIVIAFIDWHWLMIPNRLVLAGLIIAVVQRIVLEEAPVLSPFIGLSTGTAMLWLPGQISKTFTQRPGLGAGDVKLAAMLGLYFGWLEVLYVVWLACFAGAVYGLAGMCAGRLTSVSKIPLGFFLGLSAIACVMVRDWLE